MRVALFPTFAAAIDQAKVQLELRSKVVHSARWQGADIADKPEMATHELTHVSFAVDMGAELIKGVLPLPNDRTPVSGDWVVALQRDIRPNLPWADNHFEERVCGVPINPGTEWENWPYAKSAASFLDHRGMYNHNYMERYWPKFAGANQLPTRTVDEWLEFGLHNPMERPHHGIMYNYGDLGDVVELLSTDPYTRQAYLPVWFPEDTGGGSKRAPCTIGYHFLMRDGKLDINYHIRSCDFVRHFRDDLYLTARLLLWVIERAAEKDDRWREVRPGRFLMQIGSLHVFRNDYLIMTRKSNEG